MAKSTKTLELPGIKIKDLHKGHLKYLRYLGAVVNEDETGVKITYDENLINSLVENRGTEYTVAIWRRGYKRYLDMIIKGLKVNSRILIAANNLR